MADPECEKRIEELEERHERQSAGRHPEWETATEAYTWRPGDPILVPGQASS